jgi:hypothetical protein
VCIGAVLLGAGAIGAALSSATEWSQRGLLDPDSAGPAGTRALAQILRAQGVQVDVVRSLDAATAAARADDTLVLPSTAALSDDALGDLAERAGRTVLVDPSTRDVRLLLGEEPAGFAPAAAVAPDCALPDAERAGAIVPGSLFTAGDEAVEGCYPVEEGFGLITTDRTVAIDGRELFTNAHLTADGNAALALSLMGAQPRVVWYMPTIEDTDLADGDPTLGDITPPWVTPAIILLLVAGGVAILWRGRRFGPLVAENLPVAVRAAETTEGRARLYARSRDAVHALDSLRVGSLDRLARLLGLGPAARAAEIADAAAHRIGAPPALVRDILIETIPSTDADHVAASDRLRDLEAAVRASVRPERIDP